MALIQGGQMPQLQGSIGSQSIIQDTAPSAGDLVKGLTNIAADTLDTASTIVAEDRAKELVQEETANIDKAIAEAEKLDPNTEASTAVPSSVQMAQEEWDLLSQAVRTGQMSQDRAELIASSRLRSRIAKEPLFARQMRKAASGVLGFNIESTPAQQYFASFPSRAEIAKNSKNEYLAKIEEKAAAQAKYLNVPFEEARETLLRLDRNKQQLELLETQKQTGAITASEWASEISKVDSDQAFTGILTQIQAATVEGAPIDNVVVGNQIETRKQEFLTNLRTQYDGDITSPEFKRVEDAAIARYDGYKTFVDSVGVDNLTEVGLARAENLRKQIGDQFFADIQIMNSVGGQELVRQYFVFNSGDLNETQKAQMLKRFPMLGRLGNISGASPQQLKKMLANTSVKILTDQPLTEEDKQLIDPVATEIYDKGDEKSQVKVIERLRDNSMKFKGASLVLSKSPSDTSIDNITFTKDTFESDVPAIINNIGRTLARFDGGLEPYTRQDGTIGIKLRADYNPAGGINLNNASYVPGSSATRKEALKALEDINVQLSKIQPFFKGMDKGWGKILGTNKEDFKIRVLKDLDTAKKDTLSQISNAEIGESIKSFASAVSEGKQDKARSLYEKLQSKYQGKYTKPFEDVYAEIQKRQLEGAQ